MLRQIVSNVRTVHLDNPKAQAPTQHATYSKALSQMQRFVNRLSNSGHPWIVETKKMTISCDRDLYTLDLPMGGKILTVIAQGEECGCHEAWRYDVPMVEVQDIYQDGSGWAWSCPYLQQLSIYRTMKNEWKLRAVPSTTENVQIEILYTIGDISELAKPRMELALKEFHPVIELTTALALLSQARWSDDLELDIVRRKELRTSLTDELIGVNGTGGWERDFETYIQGLVQPRVVRASSGIDY